MFKDGGVVIVFVVIFGYLKIDFCKVVDVFGWCKVMFVLFDVVVVVMCCVMGVVLLFVFDLNVMFVVDFVLVEYNDEIVFNVGWFDCLVVFDVVDYVWIVCLLLVDIM